MEEKCTRCGDVAFLVSKSHKLCAFHARSQRMRNNAITKGKTCPAKIDLESMMLENVDFLCENCHTRMGMTELEFGRSRIVTLQHNSDGSFSLYCFSCNARHGVIGDSFLEEDPSKKKCHACGNFMDLDCFNSGSGFSGKNVKCRQCQSISNKHQYEKRKLK